MSPAAGTRRGASAGDVRSAYAKITGGDHRQFIRLSELRPKLGGTREQQDATILQMIRSGEAVAAPHASRERHEQGQKDAAWRGNHMIALEPPEEP